MINNYILRITAHQRFYQVLVTHLSEDITERGCTLQNAERYYSLLGQRKYIHTRINPIS